MRNLFFVSSLNDLPTAPVSLSLPSFLLDKRNIHMFVTSFCYFFINLLSNFCMVNPVNDLKSSGFLDNLSYENIWRVGKEGTLDHKSVLM